MSITRQPVFDPGDSGGSGSIRNKRHSLVRKAAAALGVAALGIATAAAGLAATAPAAHAAGSPELVTFLGGNQKNDATDDNNSEIRADFVIRVAAGDALKTTASYSYTPQTTATGAEGAIDKARTLYPDPSRLMGGGDPEGFYVQQKVTIGEWDYYAITLMSDALYPTAVQPACTNNPWKGYNAFKIDTESGASVTFTAPISLYSSKCAPTLPTTWDSAYGRSDLGNTEDNFGVNIGQDPTSFNTDETTPKAGRFVMDIRDNSGATCDTEYYEWIGPDGQAAGSGSETVTPHTSGTGTIGSGSVELAAGANLTPSGPGYYKLMAWPCTKGSADEAWQVGSVYNDVLPNVPAPVISAPADGSTITKKTGSPTTIKGTLPARTDQRAYVATDKVTVTDADGNKVCDATVVAAAAGKATTWSCDVTLKDGDYTLSATYTQASDASSGLKNLKSAASNLVSISVDRTAVAPKVDSPKDGSKLAVSPSEISGTASDALNPPGTVTVMDGKTVLCKDLPVKADGSWTCVLNGTLTVGKHTITAVYTDGVGNVSTATPVTWDVLAPGPGPTITVEPAPLPATTETAEPEPGEVIVVTPPPTPNPTTAATAAPEPLAYTGAGQWQILLSIGGVLAAAGLVVFFLARRGRAHRKALTA